jgi:hypothetical protein
VCNGSATGTRNDGRIALIGVAAFGIFLLARGTITLLK